MTATKDNLKTDEELLVAYQGAEVAAFDELFARHKTLIFNFCLSRCRCRVDAEEAFQQVFLRVHKYVGSYDASRPALAWIMGITKNVINDLWKKRALDEFEELEEHSASMELDAVVQARESLKTIFTQMSPSDQRLLEHWLFSDAPYQQIGKEEGVSEVNARQKVSRLIRRLKYQLSSA